MSAKTKSLKLEELVVGDIVVGHNGRRWGGSDGWFVSRTAYKLICGTVVIDMRRDGTNGSDPTDRAYGYSHSPLDVVEDDAFWRRRRGTSTVSTADKVVDEFPGTCTRCGRKAYVGAFEVAHQNEAAAADCPARRK